MILSMTGYGQAERRFEGYQIKVEIKSVNHRYLEINIRSGKEWLSFEEALKKSVQQKLRRGRVDVFVTIEREQTTGQKLKIDWSLAEHVFQAMEQLKRKYALQESLKIQDFLQFPDLFTSEDEHLEDQEKLHKELMNCAADALQQLVHMRHREGIFLQKELRKRLELVQSKLSGMQQKIPELTETLKHRMRQRIVDLLQDQKLFDEDRFAMEIALMAEKTDVSEEMTRLHSHLSQFAELLNSDDAVGRKMDFLIQEMNREVNTIGSKSNAIEIVQQVVEMKAELEKMREQVQNIE